MKTADEVQEWMAARLGVIFGASPATLSGESSFDSLGMDSIIRVGLTREIEQHFQISLDPDIFDEFQTVRSLCDHIAGL